MDESQEQTIVDVMLAPGVPQAVKDWNTGTGLPQAVENWRLARRQCQQQSTNETIGRYLGAEDELARALLGDLISEPMAHAIFDRFKAWLVSEEEASMSIA